MQQLFCGVPVLFLVGVTLGDTSSSALSEMLSYKSFSIFSVFLLIGKSKLDSGSCTHLPKQSVLLHNIRPQYNMDKGEIIQVWAKIVEDPWQDNRLIGGVSNPSVLSFNLTSVEHTTEFTGIITRNLTATIFENPEHVSKLFEKRANFSGEFEFHIKTFSEERSAKLSTKIALGCPTNRQLRIKGQDSKNCGKYKNFNYTLSSAQRPHEGNSKIVVYDFKTLGCPIQSTLTSAFKPIVLLYDGNQLVKEITSNFVMWETNGRNSYKYSHTMQQVGCLRSSQSWNGMVNEENNATIDQVWTQKNFRSCFEDSYNTTIDGTNLKRPYEVLNSTGGSSLKWNDDGIYVFKLRVIDPNTSFCDLTAEFGVIVADRTTAVNVIPTFIVLSSSCLGILFGCVAAFYMDAYCFC